MVIVDRKLGRVLPYRVVFFPTAEEVRRTIAGLTLGSMARLISFGGPDSPITRKILMHEVTATSCVDLSQDREKLFHSMHASTRNKIGKAQRLRSRVMIRRNHESAVDEFLEIYAGTAAVKADQVLPVNRPVLKRYARCSDIFVAYLDGKCVCGHVNLRDEQRGRERLLFSASRRFEDKEMARLAGILNCYLHWNEMLTYKEEGFRVYDLGGIALGENPDAVGIDRFKAGFGGRTVVEHSYLCAGSPLLGRTLLRIFGTRHNR
jgi:lipid II:glycine glycyltransferase (peptidoglycan interpeptide bridge formation enzyme)